MYLPQIKGKLPPIVWLAKIILKPYQGDQLDPHMNMWVVYTCLPWVVKHIFQIAIISDMKRTVDVSILGRGWKVFIIFGWRGGTRMGVGPAVKQNSCINVCAFCDIISPKYCQNCYKICVWCYQRMVWNAVKRTIECNFLGGTMPPNPMLNHLYESSIWIFTML